MKRYRVVFVIEEPNRIDDTERERARLELTVRAESSGEAIFRASRDYHETLSAGGELNFWELKCVSEIDKE
jgi:hypothetical protein